MEGVGVMKCFISLTEQEKSIADSYARLHSVSLDEAFKRALFEKIEEYDIMVFAEAHREYENNGRVSRPIEELWKALEL